MRNSSSAFSSLILATRLELGRALELIANTCDPVSTQIFLKKIMMTIIHKIRTQYSVNTLTSAEKNTKIATKVDFGPGLDELAKGGASSRG